MRHVKVLLSPMLQEGLEDFAVGTCEVPPHQMGSRHTHEDAAEIWMFSEGHGRAVVGEEEIESIRLGGGCVSSRIQLTQSGNPN